MRRTNTTGQLRPLRDRLSVSQLGRREERIIRRISRTRVSQIVDIPSPWRAWVGRVQALFPGFLSQRSTR